MKVLNLVGLASLLVSGMLLYAVRQSYAGTSSAIVDVPAIKIAVVNAEAFTDEKKGILRFANIIKEVNNEFDAGGMELQRRRWRIEQLTAGIKKSEAGRVSNPKIRAQQNQLDNLKKEYERIHESMHATFQKRMDEATRSLRKDILNALAAYAVAHDIKLILDKKIDPGILYGDQNMLAQLDVTADFIKEYNAGHPITP